MPTARRHSHPSRSTTEPRLEWVRSRDSYKLIVHRESGRLPDNLYLIDPTVDGWLLWKTNTAGWTDKKLGVFSTLDEAKEAAEAHRMPSLHDSKRSKGRQSWHVPTISEIERVMPESYCLDSSRDAHSLSVVLSGRFTPSPEYRDGLYEALYDELYGKPWCTDNERERSKIATRVRIVLQRWVGR